MFRAGALVSVCFACTTVSNEAVPNPTGQLDETVFRCNVEPILARQCSYTACHGNAQSPLRIYTPGKLRMKQPGNIDDAIAALTPEEHHANFASAAGFNYGITAVDDNWLLRKPLPAKEGGYEHKGGAIWSGGGDAQYGKIRDWLLGQGRCTP
jgi:hypothetical protein